MYTTLSNTKPPYTEFLVNLADISLGARVHMCSDEFFGDCERMLNPEPPKFVPGLYDKHGKWMDGWETRRRRDGGHDLCVIRLAFTGDISVIEVDTRYFTGNSPIGVMVEGALLSSESEPDENTIWYLLTNMTQIKGDDRVFITLNEVHSCSHVRLHIYPDGGIARLRLFGTVCLSKDITPGCELDLIALQNGGRVISWSDAHYGHPQNLLRPGKGKNMADGWETRRRREPGNDWCIISLGYSGTINRIEVDTEYFIGNFPASFSIQAAHIDDDFVVDFIKTSSMFWEYLLPEQMLNADEVHFFEKEVVELGLVTHLRFNIIPDGGVSRLRAFGNMVP